MKLKLNNTNKPRIARYALLLLVLCFALFGCSKPEVEETKSVAQLLRELDDSDPKIQEQAAKGFYQMGGLPSYDPDLDKDFEAKKSEIIIALRNHLNGDNIRVHFAAADALMKIAPGDNRDIVIPLILKDIEDINPETRKMAAWKMNFHRAALGTKKEEVITALKKHLNDENAIVRYEATLALGSLDPIKFQNIIMPTLIEMLKSGGDVLSIAMICKEIGPPAVEAVPALIELSKKSSAGYMCVEALKSIGTPEALAAAEEAERAKEKWHLRGVILNCAIILSYILFFGWSIRLRKKGKKVFPWFLLIPIAMYSLVLKYALEGDSSAVDTVLSIKFFLAFAAIGCIPWLISWFILRRRESPGASG